MELLDALHQIAQQSQGASQPTDMRVGTVVSVSPLEISINGMMAPLKAPVLILTESVIEKKFTSLAHSHETTHTHELTDLYNDQGVCQPAGNCSTELSGVQGYIDGKAVPSEGGFVIIQPGLKAGDKVLLLRVQNGQKFIVLSKVYEV